MQGIIRDAFVIFVRQRQRRIRQHRREVRQPVPGESRRSPSGQPTVQLRRDDVRVAADRSSRGDAAGVRASPRRRLDRPLVPPAGRPARRRRHPAAVSVPQRHRASTAGVRAVSAPRRPPIPKRQDAANVRLVPELAIRGRRRRWTLPTPAAAMEAGTNDGRASLPGRSSPAQLERHRPLRACGHPRARRRPARPPEASVRLHNTGTKLFPADDRLLRAAPRQAGDQSPIRGDERRCRLDANASTTESDRRSVQAVRRRRILDVGRCRIRPGAAVLLRRRHHVDGDVWLVGGLAGRRNDRLPSWVAETRVAARSRL